MRLAILQVLQSLALAVLWFTRIPLPVRLTSVDRLQQQALGWLPGIGLLVALVGVGFMDSLQGLGSGIAVLLGLAAMLLVTGALHEDGWADGWDALGACGDADRKLQVLKDPRLGTYGVLALIVSVGLQFLCMERLLQTDRALWLVIPHMAGRLAMAWLAWTQVYVRRNGEGKAEFLRQPVEIWAWMLWALWIPVLVFVCSYCGWMTLWIACASCIVTALAVLPWRRIIGGVTGDVFGFCLQSGMLAGLLVAVVLP